MGQICEHIWHHGNICTLDAENPQAQAIGTAGGKIVFVGSDAQCAAFSGANTVFHDLRGNWVYPGFIEGHLHLTQYGESLQKLAIRDKSKQEILDAVRDAVRSAEPGQWIEGGMGWNNEVWADPAYPTAAELDAVAPNNPVLLPRMDGHMIWVNSAAFAACGVTRNTGNPVGGEFMRTPDGALLGCAANAAADIVRAAVPPLDKETLKGALLAAQEKLLSYGVTSVNDMSTTLQDAQALEELYDAGAYKLRFHGALRGFLGKSADTPEGAYLEKCPMRGLYGGRFTIQACKLLGDGSVGAQSAALLEDYTDRPGHRGMLMQTDEELLELYGECARRGMQMVTHAIGDAAILQVLNTFEQLPEQLKNSDHRWHIEHFQLVTGDSRERAKQYGFIASMQPLHAPNSASMAQRRLSADRAPRAYAGGMVLDVLGRVAWGSDAPVAPPKPLSGMHAAITRTNDDLQPAGGFFLENAVSPEAALLGYTIWGAYAQFTEAQKGCLRAGMLADFNVVDGDILNIGACEPDALLKLSVLETVLNGESVYLKQ